MIVGVPREIKPGEQRVALTPGARARAEAGHRARVERENPALARGVNIWRGSVVHPGIAESVGETPTPLEGCLR